MSKEVTTNKVMKAVFIPMDEHAIAEKGKVAAQLNEEIIGLEEEFAAHKEDFNNNVKPKRVALGAALKVIQDEGENQTVECEMLTDFEDRVVKYYYEGKEVDRRELTDEDTQLSLVMPLPESAVGTESDDEDVAEVMASEKNPKKKRDHITNNHDELEEEGLGAG